MKLCIKCNEKIPNYVIIDNKKRNLQNRKLCINCSPFGSKNTLAFSLKKNNSKKEKCVLCNNLKGKSARLCNSCITKTRRFLTKEKAINYLGGKCIDCGWSGDQAGFDFHHTNPSEKSFILGNVANIKWERILDEIQKCELLCRNCHSIRHSTKNNINFLKEIEIIKLRRTNNIN